jgi:uncharacterized protein
MRVTQLWQYPVKSMIGEQVASVDIDQIGVVGDRMWAVRDLQRGGIRGGKKIPELMRLAARDLGDGRVEIRLPDGDVITTDAADVHERLSASLGHPVHLERRPGADDLDHFRRGAPDSDDFMVEVRATFGLVDDEPLPDLSAFPPEVMEFESPPGTYYDAFPLLLMTESALGALTAAVPDAVVDVRRFRPSIVVDTGSGEGHPEFGWTGRRMRIGTAEIEIVARCVRCVMITRAIDEATPEDRSILRHVVRDLEQHVGAYARVVAPGRVAVGDAAEMLT